MSNCLVCERNVTWVSGVPVHGGRLCKSCVVKLPSLLLKRGRDLQEYSLKNALQKTADNLERFSATASFGELHIDEIHGLFCITKYLTSDGKPVKGNNIFSVYDLTEVGITCTTPRESNGRVFVDVEFNCSLVNPDLKISEIIKKNCHCRAKQISKKNCEWESPPDLLMFQALFNQMITGVWEKVNEILCGKTVYEFEIEKAMALFMLHEGYTKADLMLAYNRMKKVYGNSVSSTDSNREMDIINKYYWLLQSHMERYSEVFYSRGDIVK